MRRLSRGLIVAVLVASALGPSVGRTAIASACGSEYTASATCVFYLAGGWLTVEALSSAQTNVSVLTPSGQVLLACTGSGGCSGSVGAALTDPFVDLPAGVPLTCQVTGGSGWYRCMSIL